MNRDAVAQKAKTACEFFCNNKTHWASTPRKPAKVIAETWQKMRGVVEVAERKSEQVENIY